MGKAETDVILFTEVEGGYFQKLVCLVEGEADRRMKEWEETGELTVFVSGYPVTYKPCEMMKASVADAHVLLPEEGGNSNGRGTGYRRVHSGMRIHLHHHREA